MGSQQELSIPVARTKSVQKQNLNLSQELQSGYTNLRSCSGYLHNLRTDNWTPNKEKNNILENWSRIK